MSECLLHIHVRNIFSLFVKRCPTMNLCVTQDVYQLGPFLQRESFYSLLLDWVQIWMRKLHHDIHVMNTQLAIYDADSRCLYMQIETVSTCCWDGLNLGYKRSTLMLLSHLDIYHADGKWKMLDHILQPWFHRHITQTGYFVCRWQTLQHLVLIMLNAQFEKVTAAVQVYEGIHGICWYSSTSLCLKTKLVPTSPHVSLPKIISLKRREALNSGWL